MTILLIPEEDAGATPALWPLKFTAKILQITNSTDTMLHTFLSEVKSNFKTIAAVSYILSMGIYS